MSNQLKATGMKVYVFVTDQAFDFEVFEREVKVFSNMGDACAELRRWRDSVIEYVTNKGWNVEIDVFDKFQAFVDGSYASDHCEFEVIECDAE